MVSKGKTIGNKVKKIARGFLFIKDGLYDEDEPYYAHTTEMQLTELQLRKLRLAAAIIDKTFTWTDNGQITMYVNFRADGKMARTLDGQTSSWMPTDNPNEISVYGGSHLLTFASPQPVSFVCNGGQSGQLLMLSWPQ